MNVVLQEKIVSLVILFRFSKSVKIEWFCIFGDFVQIGIFKDCNEVIGNGFFFFFHVCVCGYVVLRYSESESYQGLNFISESHFGLILVKIIIRSNESALIS